MKYNSYYKKFFTLVLITTFVISPIFAKKAEAQWAVFDVTLIGKEFGLDTIAFTVVNAVIQRVAASTVNWINSGFNGSPAFVTNPEEFFGNIGKGIAGQAIYSNPNWQFMCSSFKLKVQIAINQSYNKPLGNFQCTLDQVVKNYDNFMGDFSQGGWDGFVSITQNRQNNPLGLYTTWNNQLNQQINSKIDQQKQELLQGKGTLSYKKCNVAPFTQKDIDGLVSAGISKPGLNKPGDCPGIMETQTPGSTIESQLNQVLGSGNGRLQIADEINEIISALLNQLTSKIIGGIGSGLRSLNKPDASNGNQTYSDNLQADTKTQQDIPADQTTLDPSLVNRKLIGLPDLSGVSNPCKLANGTIGMGTADANGNCITTGTGGGGGNGNFTPITASDGSIITSMPTDPDCAAISFDDIVNKAGVIFYNNQPTYNSLGVTISTIVKNMNCGAGGILPATYP